MKVIHSSAYHPQLQGLVERSRKTLKEILDKNGQNLSQLLLNESIYAINCKEDVKKGSVISRFMARATRTSIPNSWQCSIDWRKEIDLHGEEIEKRVK